MKRELDIDVTPGHLICTEGSTLEILDFLAATMSGEFKGVINLFADCDSVLALVSMVDDGEEENDE